MRDSRAIRLLSATVRALRRANSQIGSSARRRGSRQRASSPLVSVVVPSYNVEAYLQECLASIGAQSFDNFEIIIVNDGSTDTTLDIARLFAANDARTLVIDQPNAGLSEARNVGLANARGDFVMYVDSDDTLPPASLESLLTPLLVSGSDLSVGRYERSASNVKNWTPVWIKRAHASQRIGTTLAEHPEIMANVIAMPKLYRKSFLLANNLTFLPGILYEDQEFAARVYTQATSFDVVAEVVYHWRMRDDKSSISQRTGELANSLALVDALASAAEIYRASASLGAHAARVAHLLKADLPPLATTAANGSAEHRYAVHLRLRRLLKDVTPEMWQTTPLVSRLRVYCAFLGHWDALLDFNELVRTEGLPFPAEVDSGALRAQELHFPDSLRGLPDWTRSLTDEDAALVTNLADIRWLDDNRLMISGWSLIRGLSTRPGESVIRAFLLEPGTGRRIEAPVTQYTTTAATEWARHRNAQYDASAFNVTVDFANVDLEMSSRPWSVEVTLQQDGITRRGFFTHRDRGGNAGQFVARRFAAAGTTGHLVPRYSSNSGLTLEFRPDTVVASALSMDSKGIVARATVRAVSGDPRLVLVLAINRRTNHETRGTVRLNPDGSFELRIKLPRGHEALGKAAWEIKLVDGSGRHRLIDWNLDAAVSPTPRSQQRVMWSRTPYGYAELSVNAVSAFVRFVAIEDDIIRIALLGGSPESHPAADYRIETGSVSIPASSRLVQEDGTIYLEFPTASSRFGIPLVPVPSGIYRLSVPSASGHGRQNAMVGPYDVGTIHQAWETANFAAHAWCLPAGREFRLTLSPGLKPDERGTRNQAELQRWYRRTQFEPREAILFQCYRGEVANDTQRVLHEELQRRGSQLTIYWGVHDLSVAVPDGAIRVLIGSRDWYEIVGSARFLCNNIDFDRFFQRRPHQYVLATFHGYPFKAMGRSMWESQGLSEHRIRIELERRKSEWTSIVVPSEEAAELYRAQYDYDGDVIVSGYPRNDAIVNGDRDSIRDATLAQIGVPSDRKVVLFAPTWRETMATSAWAARLFDGLDLDQLALDLGPEYTILVRGHNFNSRVDARAHNAGLVDVTDYPDINNLIHAADAAILDYSSLRFDWALTGRPAIFFVPDKREYLAGRPGLFDFDLTAPGPQLVETEQVTDALRDLDGLAEEWRSRIDDFNERFNTLHDGRATDRLMAEVADRASAAFGSASGWQEPASITP